MTNSTINITNTKFKAWLAEAAYADFSRAITESNADARDKAMQKALKNMPVDYINASFSAEQAKAFAERYDLVAHQPNRGANNTIEFPGMRSY